VMEGAWENVGRGTTLAHPHAIAGCIGNLRPLQGKCAE
jgi:hypothetical protein